jgi:hypothetical protein
VIGWYVHHLGAGHLHRARAVCSELDGPVTVLSSLPRPRDWDIPWIQLERDDGASIRQMRAGGWLHWAPLHHEGLRHRMAAVSSWIASATPDLLVSDVSVEIALLARLHGIPVVYVAMPGDRSDDPHRWGYDIAAELVGCWPGEAHGMLRLAQAGVAEKLRLVGGLSRFPVAEPARRRPGPSRVAVLMGAGGSDLTMEMLDGARAESPAWEWSVLDPALGTWREDPFPVLCDADVVITHGGQNSVAEVAAARRPAIVIPAPRPHGEQETSAQILQDGPWPAVVRWRWPSCGWSSLLDEAARLDGAAWASWCDGDAARRFADIITRATVSSRSGL